MDEMRKQHGEKAENYSTSHRHFLIVLYAVNSKFRDFKFKFFEECMRPINARSTSDILRDLVLRLSKVQRLVGSTESQTCILRHKIFRFRPYLICFHQTDNV